MRHYMEILSECHNEWVAIVRSFGGGSYSEDIVQETYLRIHHAKSMKKIVKNEKVNRAFMWITLRNNYINFAKQKSKMYKVQLEEYHMNTRIENNTLRHIANDILDDKIQAEINSWHWYDRDMFKLITSGEVSMRKVSKESKISLSSIANTMNKCRKRLKEAIGEDYEDYLNGDYQKINKVP
jgi:DNA-directed RNA polymerase specialized sigma24 family protein